MARGQRSLLAGADRDLPAGFVYRADFLGVDEEIPLLGAARALAFSEIRLRGQVARRRAVHFGWRYGYASGRAEPGPPIPEALMALRDRVGELAGLAGDAFEEVLVTEYPVGAGIGWHRDAPAFDVVVGVSLLGACRFRFARGAGPARETRAIVLEPRSAYVLAGPARWQWRHSIPPGSTPRYSLTFRTMRAEAS
jgi:alkylated DNA repair dioxygenase AlkB